MLPYVVKEGSRLSRLLLLRRNQHSHSLSSASTFVANKPRQESFQQVVTRYYSPTAKRMENESLEEVEQTPPPLFTKEDKRVAARDYNSRRAAYRRQVSRIRKQYFDEIAREKAEEEAKLGAEKDEITRRRLERQRLKNIRSAQNALKQEEQRVEREQEFHEHLRVQQIKRDEQKRLFNKARGMVLAELEAEADLWLTTPEEVEAAFTHEAEQMLWARPNGVLGSPSPSVDSHFWQYESHTMHLNKTYKTPRELLLQELLDKIYEEATVDETFWTPERVRDREELERKAKLRAMVRAEGRRSLLEKQKQLLDDYFGTAEDEVPKRMPAPNVKILGDVEAQEKEGVEILLKDPTKFFKFQNESESSRDDLVDDSDAYSGPSLGAPIELKDPLRDGTPWADVFPIGIAKQPKADTRTQREKKRQEREQKMWEAAEAEKRSEENAVEMAASDDIFGDDEDEIDYDNNDWDSDDEEWEKGLDPVDDADLLNTPPEERYTEEDIRWVINQLEINSEYLQSQMNREVDSSRQRLLAQRDEEKETEEEKRFQDMLMSLTNEQMLALVEVESQDLETMTPEELSMALSKVPGLDAEQVKRILELGDNLGEGKSPES
jgi:hypothetical protein